MVPASNRTYLAPIPDRPQPDEIRVTGYGAGYGGWRTIVYTALFVVCLLAVSDFIPLWLMCVIVFVAFLLCDRRVFRNVDWGLPLTFCMFFIFIGNMKRVPEFYELAACWWARIRWKCPWCPASSSPTCRPRCCCPASATSGVN